MKHIKKLYILNILFNAIKEDIFSMNIITHDDILTTILNDRICVHKNDNPQKNNTSSIKTNFDRKIIDLNKMLQDKIIPQDIITKIIGKVQKKYKDFDIIEFLKDEKNITINKGIELLLDKWDKMQTGGKELNKDKNIFHLQIQTKDDENNINKKYYRIKFADVKNVEKDISLIISNKSLLLKKKDFQLWLEFFKKTYIIATKKFGKPISYMLNLLTYKLSKILSHWQIFINKDNSLTFKCIFKDDVLQHKLIIHCSRKLLIQLEQKNFQYELLDENIEYEILWITKNLLNPIKEQTILKVKLNNINEPMNEHLKHLILLLMDRFEKKSSLLLENYEENTPKENTINSFMITCICILYIIYLIYFAFYIFIN